ncbi:hypothetical protein K432DRAFT_63137 [Lepidopterella palustris CBS 459.81]|uniref:Histone deacetylase n=1 Tax=Lepidopterella palustris CBS 459.81 TaxID=1314670 RepID=A0A8E2E9C0_9PEZI|nr:hypothetical protein K432DRAFT_63137 [Lepidopterella palustris CBS 459.81]
MLRPAMDGDADFLMGDGAVIGLTEMNGHHQTVDPSVFAFGGNVQSPPQREKLPILSQNNPSPTSPRPVSYTMPAASLDNAATAEASISSTASEISSDAMDVVTPPQAYIQVVLPPPPKFPLLPYSSTKSGLVYDVRMRFHTEPISSMDNEDDIHPEDPRRIFEIYDELRKAGLVEDEENMPDLDPDFQLFRIGARHANSSEICLIHSRAHYEWVRSLKDKTEDELNFMAIKLDSVYLHNNTFECATLSAGGAIEACRAVVNGNVRNAIAVIRPPGHHAEHDEPAGFCFFNNVPIAARVCQDNFPDKCRKILILDWDVHHGNGVQHAFYDDPNVLYISLHVHKNGQFYPGKPDGDHQHCGEGLGLGKNVNIPWADHGMADGDYMFAFQQVVMPIATEFAPDLVIVSAGFDAAEGDKLGGCHVSPPCYAHMTHMLMSLAKGKIAICLEGGYNLRSIAKSALAVTRTLMGEPPDRLDELEPSPLGVSTVQLVMRQQSKFWKCMYPKEMSKSMKDRVGGERLHDIIREWQSKVMFEEFSMTSLFILREKISKSFENQVLATPNYFEARPLLVIFHDPPEAMHVPDPQTNKTELHNTWLTDVTKNYVDWAVKHDFAVIDVNIPKHITDPDDEGGYVEGDDADVRAAATSELATYLWENYIEVNESTDVFLMGVGAAYSGLIELLSRHESCTDESSPIRSVISFVAENPLQSVKRPADDYIGNWYHQHSLVFVANNHLAWDPSRTRKLRKKYGKLVRSPHTNLNEMLAEHKSEVTRLLLEDTEGWRKEQAQHNSTKRSAANSFSLRLDERDMRAASVPNSLRSPGMPPVGMFTVSSSPRSPIKR